MGIKRLIHLYDISAPSYFPDIDIILNIYLL